MTYTSKPIRIKFDELAKICGFELPAPRLKPVPKPSRDVVIVPVQPDPITDGFTDPYGAAVDLAYHCWQATAIAARMPKGFTESDLEEEILAEINRLRTILSSRGSAIEAVLVRVVPVSALAKFLGMPGQTMLSAVLQVSKAIVEFSIDTEGLRFFLGELNHGATEFNHAEVVIHLANERDASRRSAVRAANVAKPKLSPLQEAIYQSLTDEYQSAVEIAHAADCNEDNCRRELPNLGRFGLVEHIDRVGYRRAPARAV